MKYQIYISKIIKKKVCYSMFNFILRISVFYLYIYIQNNLFPVFCDILRHENFTTHILLRKITITKCVIMKPKWDKIILKIIIFLQRFRKTFQPSTRGPVHSARFTTGGSGGSKSVQTGQVEEKNGMRVRGQNIVCSSYLYRRGLVAKSTKP